MDFVDWQEQIAVDSLGYISKGNELIESAPVELGPIK